MCGENDRAVGLAHNLEPFTYLGPEHRVPEHNPGLIQHQNGGRTVQGLFNAPEQIGQHRHKVFVAQVHEVFDFEDHEARKVQVVRVSVQQSPHGPLHAVMLDGLFDLPVLHHVVETGQGTQMRRVGSQRLHGCVNGVARA